MNEKTPLLIGLRAARANLIPGLLIQAAMIAIALAYYFWPAAREWLDVLATAKARGGLAFTLVASILAGAVLPELLTVLIFQRGILRRENLHSVLFLAVFWGFNGWCVDVFYQSQAWVFGSHADFATVCKKVLVDQFVYTPLFATPLGMFCYEWRNQNFAPAGMSRTLTWTFYKNKSFPALLASWGVWFPLVAVIYSLPSSLQFPIFSLALTFWVLMFSYINARARQPQTEPLSPTAVAQEA